MAHNSPPHSYRDKHKGINSSSSRWLCFFLCLRDLEALSHCFTLVFPPILPHTQTRFKHLALTPVPMATPSIGDQPPGPASRSFLPPHCLLRTGLDIWGHHLNANTLTSLTIFGVQLGSISKLPYQILHSTLILVSLHLV